MGTPNITPKEKAVQLINEFLIVNGVSPRHQISIEEYMNARECSKRCIDQILNFMKDDDDLHEDVHFANSIWIDFYQKVREFL
jgi:hypothetical protein